MPALGEGGDPEGLVVGMVDWAFFCGGEDGDDSAEGGGG